MYLSTVNVGWVLFGCFWFVVKVVCFVFLLWFGFLFCLGFFNCGHFFLNRLSLFLELPASPLLSYSHFPAPFLKPVPYWSAQLLCSTSLAHWSPFSLCFTSGYFLFLLVLITLVLTQQNYLELGMPCLQAEQNTTAKPRLLQDLLPQMLGE